MAHQPELQARYHRTALPFWISKWWSDVSLWRCMNSIPIPHWAPLPSKPSHIFFNLVVVLKCWVCWWLWVDEQRHVKPGPLSMVRGVESGSVSKGWDQGQPWEGQVNCYNHCAFGLLALAPATRKSQWVNFWVLFYAVNNPPTKLPLDLARFFLRQCEVGRIEIDLFLSQKGCSLLSLTWSSSSYPILAAPPGFVEQSLCGSLCCEETLCSSLLSQSWFRTDI